MKTVRCYSTGPDILLLHVCCLMRSQEIKTDFSEAITHFHVPHFIVSILRTSDLICRNAELL